MNAEYLRDWPLPRQFLNTVRVFLIVLAATLEWNLRASDSNVITEKASASVAAASSPTRFKENGKWGYKLNAATMLPAQFDYAGIFYGGMAKVWKNNDWAYIDTSGTVLGHIAVTNTAARPEFSKQELVNQKVFQEASQNEADMAAMYFLGSRFCNQ